MVDYERSLHETETSCVVVWIWWQVVVRALTGMESSADRAFRSYNPQPPEAENRISPDRGVVGSTCVANGNSERPREYQPKGFDKKQGRAMEAVRLDAVCVYVYY